MPSKKYLRLQSKMRKRGEEFVSEIQGVLIVKIQNSNISHHSQSPNKHFKMIIPTSRSAGISVLVFVICTVDAREKRKADFLHVIRIQLSLILKTLFFIKVLQFIVKKGRLISIAAEICSFQVMSGAKLAHCVVQSRIPPCHHRQSPPHHSRHLRRSPGASRRCNSYPDHYP